MNIDKAIEILIRFEGGHHRNLSAARHNALKLGIEALKREQLLRREIPYDREGLLPGETKEPPRGLSPHQEAVARINKRGTK